MEAGTTGAVCVRSHAGEPRGAVGESGEGVPAVESDVPRKNRKKRTYVYLCIMTFAMSFNVSAYKLVYTVLLSMYTVGTK